MSATIPSPPPDPEAKRSSESPAESNHVPRTIRRPSAGEQVVAYLFILLGVFFLLATQFPLGGSLVLFAIGLAFLVARFTTGHYGFAVPAGILIGLGAFVALNDAGVLRGDNGGWATLLLGAGFLLVYPLGGRFDQVWPIIPAAILMVIGVSLLGAPVLAPLATLAWLGYYWPLGLIAIGLWLLVRDQLPASVRPFARGIFLVVLIAYAVLAVAATSAASPFGTFWYDPTASIPAAVPFGQTTSTLNAPIAATGTLQIANDTSGAIRVVPGSDSNVQVQVIRSAGFGPTPAVSLNPVDGGLLLQARHAGGSFTPSSAVSFVVTAPPSVAVAVEGRSGAVRVEDRQAAVRVTTSSGSIFLAGTFKDTAAIQSSSGSISLQLAADSSTRIEANSSSGTIAVRSLDLTGVSQSDHHLSGTLGTGTGSLSVTTSSGSINLEGTK